MSKADLSFNGLIGVMEAVVETAKRFQDFEDRYRSNEAAFDQIQQQFQQIQDGAAQLQSLTEERLASLSALSVELKARHSQGEQTLDEVRTLIGEIKAEQARLEQGLSAAESRSQVGADRSGQLAQMLGVVEALVEKLQERQGHLEQSLVAVQTLVRDQDKRYSDQEAAVSEARTAVEQVADRQSQIEKTLGLFQATQQAEKSLISHFEKALNTIRSTVVELEKRQAQVELGLASIKATGTDATMINQNTVGAAAELMKDLGGRQEVLAALIEEVRQASLQSAEQVAKIEKISAQAAEGAQSARDMAAQALEKVAGGNAGVAGESPALVGEPDSVAVQAAIEQFLVDSQARLEQTWATWTEQREQRMAELDKRHQDLVEGMIEQHRGFEQQLSRLSAAAQPHSTSADWKEAVESVSAAQGSELRFIKTLVWITLAAVGLSYALVAYAVILRSSQ